MTSGRFSVASVDLINTKVIATTKSLLMVLVVAVSLLGVFGAPCVAMEFTEHFNGAMRIDNESTWISAEGEITATSPQDFEKFLNSASIFKSHRIVLNSGGGNVIAGMQLGDIIRRYGLRTAVGASKKNGEFSIVGPGECASACVFGLAGGTERVISPGSKIGLHQYAVDFNKLLAGNTLAIGDLDRAFAEGQTVMGLTLSFFISMGIDPRVAIVMTKKSPNDIYWMTEKEAVDLKVLFQPRMFESWKVEPNGDGLIAYSRSVDGKSELTLMCSVNTLRFKLVISSDMYEKDFIETIEAVDGFDVIGFFVRKGRFEIAKGEAGVTIAGNLGVIIGGSLEGSGERIERTAWSTFSLYGHAIGTLSDLYSLYHFNERNFDQSFALVKKNCMS
jgi:hypothetical protein